MYLINIKGLNSVLIVPMMSKLELLGLHKPSGTLFIPVIRRNPRILPIFFSDLARSKATGTIVNLA
jgi:hypothetical protein